VDKYLLKLSRLSECNNERHLDNEIKGDWGMTCIGEGVRIPMVIGERTAEASTNDLEEEGLKASPRGQREHERDNQCLREVKGEHVARGKGRKVLVSLILCAPVVISTSKVVGTSKRKKLRGHVLMGQRANKQNKGREGQR